MHYLFEPGDTLHAPIECFYYDPATQEFPVKPHWHYFMEIIYILEGSAEMQTEDKKHILCRGEMILFHPKTLHGIYQAGKETLRYAVLKFDINRLTLTAAYAPKLRSIFRSAQKSGTDVVFPADFTEHIAAESFFSECIEETNRGGYGSDLVVMARVYELLIKILRRWQGQGFSVDSEAYAEDSRCDIYNITEYIDEHLSDKISVNDIASICGISYSYFAKRFLAVYGTTCKEYIEKMRLFKVEEFLQYTDFDLNYIAQETGFSDCSHMIRSFKKSRGITPKQFRLGRKK